MNEAAHALNPGSIRQLAVRLRWWADPPKACLKVVLSNLMSS